MGGRLEWTTGLIVEPGPCGAQYQSQSLYVLGNYICIRLGLVIVLRMTLLFAFYAPSNGEDDRNYQPLFAIWK